jgi:hypothetical protein
MLALTAIPTFFIPLFGPLGEYVCKNTLKINILAHKRLAVFAIVFSGIGTGILAIPNYICTF